MTTSLLRRPDPFAKESLWGYVLRVSECNGYHDPRILLEVAGLGREWRNQPLPGLPVGELAEVLGQSEKSLLPLAIKHFVDGGEIFQIRGHPLGGRPSALLSYRMPSVCPECVHETGFVSNFWDLRVATTCPRHQVQAVRACATCGTSLTWFREGILRCSCGAELRPSDTATCPTEVELLKLVEGKLFRTAVGTASGLGFPVAWIEQTPLASLLYAMDKFNDMVTTVNAELQEDQQLTVAKVLADWPNGYHRLLRALGEVALRASPDTAGFCKQLARLYQPLFRSAQCPKDFDFLRQEFIRFGRNEWGKGAIDAKLVGAEIRDPARFVSKTDFARMHSINNPTLNRMIRDGDVVAVRQGAGRRSRTIIDTELSKVPQHVEAGEKTVEVRDAAKLIGLPVQVIKALRRLGTLEAPLRTGKGGTWYQTDLDKFLRKVGELSKGQSPNDGAICVAELMRLKLRDATTKAKIVSAAVDKKLKVIGSIGLSVSDLQLDRAEVYSFVGQLRIVSHDGSRSLPQAAEVCGISQDAVADAIAQGLLSVKTIKGWDRVTADSIDVFIETYVPLLRLARDLETTTRPLVKICEDLGLDTLKLRRSGSPSPQPLIQAEDADKVILEFQERRQKSASRTFEGRNRDQVARLKAYLEQVGGAGHLLPRRNGVLNRSAIANACGFDRCVLEGNEICAALLEEAGRMEQSSGVAELTSAEKLERYLAHLREAGKSIPIWRGRPNMLQLARECGFDRSVFEREPKLYAKAAKYAAAYNRVQPERTRRQRAPR